MSRKFFAASAISQVVVGAAWAAWMLLSDEGLFRLVGLIPTLALFAGAASALLAVRVAGQKALADDEVQRVKTMSRLETEAEALRERLEHFAMLSQWGIITEEELLAKRRALLDLEAPSPGRPEVDHRAEGPDDAARTSPGDIAAKSRPPAERPHVTLATKGPRKPASRH